MKSQITRPLLSVFLVFLMESNLSQAAPTPNPSDPKTKMSTVEDTRTPHNAYHLSSSADVQQHLPINPYNDHDHNHSHDDTVVDPVHTSHTQDEGALDVGTGKNASEQLRTKRQHYDHSHCYSDHCHDYYSDGHSHVRYHQPYYNNYYRRNYG